MDEVMKMFLRLKLFQENLHIYLHESSHRYQRVLEKIDDLFKNSANLCVIIMICLFFIL